MRLALHDVKIYESSTLGHQTYLNVLRMQRVESDVVSAYTTVKETKKLNTF